MRFGAAFWIQRTGWPDLRDACLAAERAGWDSIWLDDHLLADEGDPDDPKLEGWASLAAVAAATERVRVGLLVSANTFRNPGLTAKLATTLDHVSGGRAILGLGGGWFEREHEAFGLDFGSGFGERLDRLDEATMLIRGLLDGETITFDGRFYRFHDARCEPRPVQRRLPILIGGSGPRKTLRIVARHADAWNAYGSPDAIAASDAILREHCRAVGRDERAIERTVTLDVTVRDSPAAATAAFDRIAAVHGLEDKTGAESGARYVHLLDTPAAIADRIRDYAAVGVGEVMWIFRHPFDRETIGRLGEVRDALADPSARS